MSLCALFLRGRLRLEQEGEMGLKTFGRHVALLTFRHVTLVHIFAAQAWFECRRGCTSGFCESWTL